MQGKHSVAELCPQSCTEIFNHCDEPPVGIAALRLRVLLKWAFSPGRVRVALRIRTWRTLSPVVWLPLTSSPSPICLGESLVSAGRVKVVFNHGRLKAERLFPAISTEAPTTSGSHLGPQKAAYFCSSFSSHWSVPQDDGGFLALSSPCLFFRGSLPSSIACILSVPPEGFPQTQPGSPHSHPSFSRTLPFSLGSLGGHRAEVWLGHS